jgi:hypothetical protein
MRFVAWNCNGGFRKKREALLNLNPDVAVISEARESCLAALDNDATSYVWAGKTGSKGVAIIGFDGWKLDKIEIGVSDNWFVPVVVTKGARKVQIIGVWVKRTDRGYVEPTLRALRTLRNFIVGKPTFILGDFNQSVRFDKGRGPGRRFKDVIAAFEALNLRSAWHAASSEAHGDEGAPTLHWKWQADSSYHVDYAFVPSAIVSATKVRIGKFEDYVATKLSDHVPLTIDVDL